MRDTCSQRTPSRPAKPTDLSLKRCTKKHRTKSYDHAETPQGRPSSPCKFHSLWGKTGNASACCWHSDLTWVIWVVVKFGMIDGMIRSFLHIIHIHIYIYIYIYIYYKYNMTCDIFYNQLNSIGVLTTWTNKSMAQILLI